MAKTSRVLHFVDCKWTISSTGKVIYMGSNGVAASIGRLADVLWNAVKAPNANLVDVIKFTVAGGPPTHPQYHFRPHLLDTSSKAWPGISVSIAVREWHAGQTGKKIKHMEGFKGT